MTMSQFLRLFKFLCDIFFSFFKIILDIHIVGNIYFGNLLLIVVIFSVVIGILKRPVDKG